LIGRSAYVTSVVQASPALTSSPAVSGVNATTGFAHPVTLRALNDWSMSMLLRIVASCCSTVM
jgi:hypothetical protein